ncbi:MAG: hypothetical protein ACXWH7_08860 [Thermoanaerobaculia bacterium]
MSVAEPPAIETSDEIKDLVQRHKVCFESYPIWHVPHGGGKVAIGYELDLIGTHDQPQPPATTGGDEYTPVRRALLAIAAAILPPNDGAGCYAMEPFEAAIHFSPRRKMREDVILVIDIVDRNQFDLPIDASEMRCLREMKEKLKELGARPDQW